MDGEHHFQRNLQRVSLLDIGSGVRWQSTWEFWRTNRNEHYRSVVYRLNRFPRCDLLLCGHGGRQQPPGEPIVSSGERRYTVSPQDRSSFGSP